MYPTRAHIIRKTDRHPICNWMWAAKQARAPLHQYSCTPKPTSEPTPKPTPKLTPKPTSRPTPKPTNKPTRKPTRKPIPRAGHRLSYAELPYGYVQFTSGNATNTSRCACREVPSRVSAKVRSVDDRGHPEVNARFKSIRNKTLGCWCR